MSRTQHPATNNPNNNKRHCEQVHSTPSSTGFQLPKLDVTPPAWHRITTADEDEAALGCAPRQTLPPSPLPHVATPRGLASGASQSSGQPQRVNFQRSHMSSGAKECSTQATASRGTATAQSRSTAESPRLEVSLRRASRHAAASSASPACRISPPRLVDPAKQTTSYASLALRQNAALSHLASRSSRRTPAPLIRQEKGLKSDFCSSGASPLDPAFMTHTPDGRRSPLLSARSDRRQSRPETPLRGAPLQPHSTTPSMAPQASASPQSPALSQSSLLPPPACNTQQRTPQRARPLQLSEAEEPRIDAASAEWLKKRGWLDSGATASTPQSVDNRPNDAELQSTADSTAGALPHMVEHGTADASAEPQSLQNSATPLPVSLPTAAQASTSHDLRHHHDANSLHHAKEQVQQSTMQDRQSEARQQQQQSEQQSERSEQLPQQEKQQQRKRPQLPAFLVAPTPTPQHPVRNQLPVETGWRSSTRNLSDQLAAVTPLPPPPTPPLPVASWLEHFATPGRVLSSHQPTCPSFLHLTYITRSLQPL